MTILDSDEKTSRRVGRKRRGRPLRALVLELTVGGAAGRLEGAMAVSLVADPPSPAPVGTMISWTARVSGTRSDDLWLGSAQKLQGGGYHFNAGLVFDPSGLLDSQAFSMQVDPAGTIVNSIEVPAPVYRSFRIGNLYGPDDGPARQSTVAVPVRQ